MKVHKFNFFFLLLFFGLAGFSDGITSGHAENVPEETWLSTSLFYAPVILNPADNNPFVSGAELFERGTYHPTEKAINPVAVKYRPVMKNDPGNKAPKAHAGNYKDLKDEDGNGKETLQLDGSKSSDKDGRIVSYSWTLENTDTELASGVNPAVDFPVGSTWIVLTVTDDGGLTDSQKVKIRVKEGDNKRDKGEVDNDNDGENGENQEGETDDDGDDDDDEDDDEEEKDDEEEEKPGNKAPVADAGADRRMTDADKDGKEDVKLDGSKSKDEDGSIESYSWSVGGNKIADGEKPVVSLETGTHTVKLTVTDNGGLTASDETEISISVPANKAPKANAGKDQQKTDSDRNGKESIELNGSGSKDPDGSIEGYSWKVKGNEIASGISPVVELSTGTTTVELTVTDNEGLTATDKVTIIIKEVPNEAPVARAGENQILTEEAGAGITEVQLDGSGSTDADGEIVSYSWTVAGTEIATGREAEVSLTTGIHTITLTVTDNEGATGTDETEIRINEAESKEEEEKPANQAPIAHAGADQELTDSDGNGKERVQLDGSGSADEDGKILSYNWSTEGSEKVFATGAKPTAELPAGSNAIMLKVTDDDGSTHTDTVIILIKETAEETPADKEEDDPIGGEGTAFLPNLFSPNGDQMNDVFTLEATHVEQVHLQIYNRQGLLVYETRDADEAIRTGWDGTAFGEPQPAGSFVWILEGTYEDGSPILIEGDIKGNITLIR